MTQGTREDSRSGPKEKAAGMREEEQGEVPQGKCSSAVPHAQPVPARVLEGRSPFPVNQHGYPITRLSVLTEEELLLDDWKGQSSSSGSGQRRSFGIVERGSRQWWALGRGGSEQRAHCWGNGENEDCGGKRDRSEKKIQ